VLIRGAGLQVILGAFTTGLSAGLQGHDASIAVTVLGQRFKHILYGDMAYRSMLLTGGMSTLVATYLARMRGSNEPELSITRKKDLDHFLRECKAFQMDHGHEEGQLYNAEIQRYRNRFEELLGNADG
jgi:hypothetical protein